MSPRFASGSAKASLWCSNDKLAIVNPAPVTTTADGSEFVQSLARGLSVITAFDAEHSSMTLTEVAERTGFSRATARRFLLTLEQLGYVRVTGKDFALTPRVLELGYSYLSSQGLADVIAPHLNELSAEVHESASAAVLDGNDIVYIARSAARKIMQVNITIGTRFPAYATSMGRALLAGLPETDAQRILFDSHPAQLTEFTRTTPAHLTEALDTVRAQGYAFVDQELELGLRALAMPLRDARGNVIAAVNISSSNTTMDVLLPALQRCVLAIEADLATR